ncbi:MAG: class I SAM-dependent methyltransferase [Thermoplasmatota archaeon]
MAEILKRNILKEGAGCRAVAPGRSDFTPLDGFDPGINLRRKLSEHVVRKAGLFPQDRAMEIGCGAGLLAVALAKAFTRCSVIATDSREDAILRTRTNAIAAGSLRRLLPIRAQPDALPFRDETIHFAVAAFSFSARKRADDAAALAELHRAVAYYGKVLFIDADLTNASSPHRGVAKRALGPKFEDSMRAVGFGKIQRQKLAVVPGSISIESIAAKRFDLEDIEEDASDSEGAADAEGDGAKDVPESSQA